MPRAFNVEVFNQYIGGDATSPPVYYTSEDYAALLGSVNRIKVQVIVDSVANTGTSVSVDAQRTNTLESQCWVDSETEASTKLNIAVAPSSLTDVPKTGKLTIVAGDGLGAFNRFVVKSSEPGAAVRIVVSGYNGYQRSGGGE